jgi:hypothetical protein
MTANHCAEEQRYQYPTNKLSFEHCDILYNDPAFFLVIAWISAAVQQRVNCPRLDPLWGHL